MTLLADEMTSTLTVPSATLPLSRVSGIAEDLVYRLPGCSDLMVRKELQNALRSFCRVTGALRVSREYSIPSDGRVPLATALEASVQTVHGVAFGDVAVNRAYLSVEDGTPPVLVLSESALSMAAALGATTVAVVYSLVPLPGAEEVPEWFLRDHWDGIASGAMSRLFSMLGRPWSDPAQAKDEASAYNVAVTAACLKTRRGGKIAGDLSCRNSKPWL